MAEFLLDARGISKGFPGVRALAGVDLQVRAGEVHVLLGENGAGKSTLMKVLAGVHAPDAGSIHWDGAPVTIDSPRRARALGIATIYQEFSLVPDLTIAENLFLGREPMRAPGLIDFKRLHAQARAALAALALDWPVDRPVRELSVAAQQMLEIARAVAAQARLITMDEPTAALAEREAQTLFATIERLAASGVAVIYISHRMPELFAIGHQVTVLRDGQSVGRRAIAQTDPTELIRMMVGRELQELYPPGASRLPGPEALSAEDLRRDGALDGVSLALHQGEIVGVAGLVGSGRTELLRALFGADPARGTIRINGQATAMRSPRDGVRAGIGFLTEDRKGQGLALGMSVRENTTLASLARFTRRGLLSRRLEGQEVAERIRQLAIRTPTGEQACVHLSGGNQQKVVLAKWLATHSAILFFDEPTRGIDVGARSEIYALMREQANAGKAVLMVSSDLSEVLGMSDRVLVMSRGRIAGELARSEASQEAILALATRA